jgi:2-keto-4-pentenoate hydratase/2-oxohepta-3-ene-1,7-dioic acid hydratase in catechol pathway
MKIVRYTNPEGDINYGCEEPDGSRFRLEGDPFGGFSVTEEPARVAQLLSPVAPVAIWCVGQNYRQHAKEVGAAPPEFPVIFAKGVNSVQRPGGPVILPADGYSSEVDYECELVIVIGKTCKNAARKRALEYVAGYTCGNDVSARDWQLKWGGSQWCRGKSFDTFAPMGPCMVTPDSLPDPGDLRIQTILNGTVMQDADTSDMIFDVPTLIAFLSKETTLLPGTVIFTGTPHGVGMARKPPRWLAEGDEISVVIEKIGTLTNRVCKEGS